MEKKVKSKEELLKEKESIMEQYNSYHRKSDKLPMLAKKERKALGIDKDKGKAKLRYARIAPRKVKIVIDLIKNKGIDEVYGILRYTPKAASEILFKLIKSAEANAINNNGLNRDNLYLAEATADQGTVMKRTMPRAQGRAFRIKKRTSHVTVVLKERN